MSNASEIVITADEASEILGVDRKTVVRWANEGSLPAIRKLPGRTGTWIFDSSIVRRKALETSLRKAG